MYNDFGNFISSDNEASYEINQNKLKFCKKSKLLKVEKIKKKMLSFKYIKNKLGDENNG